MNIQQAKKAMARILGKDACWRYDERAPKQEERDLIRSTLPDLKALVEQRGAALEQRKKELLTDPRYIQLMSEYQSVRKIYDDARGKSHWYRVTIGKSFSFGMHVLVQADNWQDGIDQLNLKQKENKL